MTETTLHTHNTAQRGESKVSQNEQKKDILRREVEIIWKKEPNTSLKLNYIIFKITHLLSGLNSSREINRKNNGSESKRFH